MIPYNVINIFLEFVRLVFETYVYSVLFSIVNTTKKAAGTKT